MKLVLSIGPNVEPVEVEDFVTHSRITVANEPDYAYLRGLLKAGRQEVENASWSALISQTWEQYFDAFADPLVLDMQPVLSITSITYTDTDEATQTLATSVYELGEDNGKGIVRLKYSQTWPATLGYEDVVKVTFKAGYGTTPEDVPEHLKSAIRIYAAHYYEHREGEKDLPEAFFRLLDGNTFHGVPA